MIWWQPAFQNVTIDLVLTNPAGSIPSLDTAATKNKQNLHIKIIVGFWDKNLKC